MEMQLEGQPPQAPTPIWNWKDVFLISLASVVIILAGVLILARLMRLNPEFHLTTTTPTLLYSAALAALEAVALVGSVYFAGMRRHGLSWAEVGLRPISINWLKRALLVTVLAIPLIGVIALAIRYALGLPMENPQMQFLVPKTFTWPDAAAMLVMGGVAVPFAEELFFRGVIYRWLRDRLGVWIAAILSAAVFGVLHGDVSVAGATFVMGLILAIFYQRSKSLWPSVLIHAAFNSLELLLLYITLASGAGLG